jgi:phosphatidylinositol glycan class Q protein
LTSFQDVVISSPQSALRWLDSWPAGLKLNTELSQFYSGTFVDLVDVWGGEYIRFRSFTYTRPQTFRSTPFPSLQTIHFLFPGVLHHIIFPHLHTIIYIFGLISSFGALIGGMGGMTIAIALFYDMFVVFTLHIYVCYAIAEVAYARALWGMGSLWRLFRGKRFNVLRNRTDTWEYDIDQLLFGTILFTLLTFLFPTVLAYYTLFALLRLATIIIQASLEMQLAFMNHFPLFALVLRVKDPWRLPGGVYFDFVKVRRSVPPPSDEKELSSGSRPPVVASTPDIGDSEKLKPVEDQVSMLVPIVKNQPVTLGRIFFQYTRLWGHLASHYDPLQLLKLLLLGRFLVPIPRHEIRYDKIGLSPRKHS